MEEENDRMSLEPIVKIYAFFQAKLFFSSASILLNFFMNWASNVA